jgi:ABC-type polysaccharide/polyol phosphate transport system ATPase subunit
LKTSESNELDTSSHTQKDPERDQPPALGRILVEVKNVSKRFRYWDDRPTSFKTLLVQLVRGRFELGQRREFQALSNINFDVRAGEFVGIMGRNGAGKSTLMKILAGIYEPSSGEIKLHDQIAPLIELGAGFHPDLSGYENIYLNAAVLGFGKAATEAAIPAILEFAELGEKIHMPIKNYSSGMLVRLGFSIATHLAAPILLVDELLAVGDYNFQQKCINKIHELHREGRTIVLITHDPKSVADHCGRCIVIDQTRIIFDGSGKVGAAIYLATMDQVGSET